MDERIKYLYIAFLRDKTKTIMTHPYSCYSNYKDDPFDPSVPVYYEWDHPHNGDPNYSVLFNLGDPPEEWVRNRCSYRFTPGGWARSHSAKYAWCKSRAPG